MLEQQVRRMLADPRSAALVTNFAAQWLYLRDIDAKLPDEVLFQDFDETLRHGAARAKRSCSSTASSARTAASLELLTANYTFLNERLAKHYGIPNVRGSYFRRVTLPDGQLARRPARARQRPDDHLVLDAHVAGAARQVGAREPAVGARRRRPRPMFRRLKTEGAAPGKVLTMREAMIRHRANPVVCQLPRPHGSDRLRDGELRRRGALARHRRRRSPSTPPACFRKARNSTESPG